MKRRVLFEELEVGVEVVAEVRDLHVDFLQHFVSQVLLHQRNFLIGFIHQSLQILDISDADVDLGLRVPHMVMQEAVGAPNVVPAAVFQAHIFHLIEVMLFEGASSTVALFEKLHHLLQFTLGFSRLLGGVGGISGGKWEG